MMRVMVIDDDDDDDDGFVCLFNDNDVSNSQL